jgi:hypothetical protein
MKNYLPELKRYHEPEAPEMENQISCTQNSSMFSKLKKLTLFSILFIIFSLVAGSLVAQDETTDEIDPRLIQSLLNDHVSLDSAFNTIDVTPLIITSQTKSATILKSGNIPLKSVSTSDPIWPEQGAVHIEKTAEATTTDGRWKINLSVVGKNIQTTSDVILVIDDSGSMSGTKMTNAKVAAKNFVDQLLDGTTNTRIAIVTINSPSSSWYGTTPAPEVDQNFTNNKTVLKNAIDAINACGTTNLQGGFYQARSLMSTSIADHKSVVLMSDGDPNRSYETITAVSDVTPQYCPTNSWVPTRDEMEASHLTITACTYTSISSFEDYYSYTENGSCGTHTLEAGNHGLTTMYEAGLVIGMGVDVYTIGFEVTAGGFAETVLQGSQNKGYYPATSSNISDIYAEIGANIAYAASDAVITDPMSTYVVLESATTPTWGVAPSSADVVVSKGTVSFTQNGWVLNDPDDPGSGNSTIKKWKITWNIGTVNEDPGDEMYYYVNMATNTDPTILYDANEQTYMDYTDVNGNTAHQQTNDDFTIPKVSGGKGSIEIFYYLVNDAGQPINSSGTVVISREYAYRIPQDGDASSYFEDGGSTALELSTTYSVSGETPYSSSDGSDYTVHSNYATAQSITPTSSEPNKEVWFGYVEVVCSLSGASGSASTIQCNGETSNVTLTAVGGNLPITYSLQGQTSQTVSAQNHTFTGIPAGTYAWSVDEDGDCDAITGSITITEPSEIIATDAHSDVSCNGESDGSVTITFSGGTAPYKVSFNGGSFDTQTSPITYSGLAAGSYAWTVKDANDCEKSGSETVSTIPDTEDPTITCPDDLDDVIADAGMCSASLVDLGNPTTDDNCGVASVTNDAPSTFPVGTTNVTWTVTD